MGLSQDLTSLLVNDLLYALAVLVLAGNLGGNFNSFEVILLFYCQSDKDGKLVKIENGVTVTVYDEVEKEIKKDLPTRSHARRQMLKVLNPVVEVPADAAGKKKNTKEVDLVAKLFDEYAPKYATRKGGYTRIVKIGQRKGDAAMTVVLELV
jgi:large subunit ribosomal protein L17